MDIIDEQWIQIGHKRDSKSAIVAISNTGKFIKSNGDSGVLEKSKRIRTDSGRLVVSHIIAEHFLITVRRPDQNQIDHITHFPKEYNVNDVRNLRWCTNIENMNFEEARDNRSKSLRGDRNPMYGRTGNLNPRYGKLKENVKPPTLYGRALKAFRNGEISEEEVQKYRDIRKEYIRAKRSRMKQISSQSSVNR